MDNRPPSPAALLQRVLDDMIERFGETSSGDRTADIAAARRDYDDRRGRVFEDEDLWESWTQAFLEWYVVERPAGDAPPAARYLAELRGEGGEAGDEAGRRRAAVRAWLTSYRSLFEIRTMRPGRVELVDVLGGGHFVVAEQRAMAGVSTGQVAELRLVGFDDRVHFGRTFCFHPPGTRESIIAHARRMTGDGKSRDDIMDFCASLRIRSERYRHVSARRIYEIGTVTRARQPAAGPRPGSGKPDRGQ